jgi:hypothetical protein
MEEDTLAKALATAREQAELAYRFVPNSYTFAALQPFWLNEGKPSLWLNERALKGSGHDAAPAGQPARGEGEAWETPRRILSAPTNVSPMKWGYRK